MAPKQVSIGVQVELQAKASSMKKLYEDVSNLMANIDPGSALAKSMSKALGKLRDQVSDFESISGKSFISSSDLTSALNLYKRFYRDINRMNESVQGAGFSSFIHEDSIIQALQKIQDELDNVKSTAEQIKSINIGDAFKVSNKDQKSIKDLQQKFSLKGDDDTSIEDARKIAMDNLIAKTEEYNKALARQEELAKSQQKIAIQMSQYSNLRKTYLDTKEQEKNFSLGKMYDVIGDMKGNWVTDLYESSFTDLVNSFFQTTKSGQIEFADSGYDRAEALANLLGIDLSKINQDAATIQQEILKALSNISQSKFKSIISSSRAIVSNMAEYQQAKTAFNTLGISDKDYAALQNQYSSQKTELNNLASNISVLESLRNDAEILQQQINDLYDAVFSNLQKEELDKRRELHKQQKDIQNLSTQPTKQAMPDIVAAAGQDVSQLGEDVERHKAEIRAQQEAENFKANLQASIKHWMGAQQIITYIKQGIRQAYQDIQGLDKAMTNIAVVTDFNVSDLWGKINEYMAIAKQYGVTTQGVYEVSQLYFQQGLGEADTMALTTETLKMARIAGMEYKDAADGMTVALRGFKMEMEDAARVTDVYSKVAAVTASDSQELIEAMSKTASSAASVGSGFEETTAMLAVMIEATREAPTNIGSAMKSIISRYGEMTKGMSVDTEGEEIVFNKVDAALQSVGVSMKDATGQFREFDEVIYELASKWESLDSLSQRYVATVFAGNRQQSRFLALMSNYDRLVEVTEDAQNSEDAGLLQYSKTLDSLETKLNNIKTSFQQFYMDIFNGPVIGAGLEFINNLIKGFNKLGKVTSIFNIVNIVKGIKQLANIGVNSFSNIGSSITQSIKNGFSQATLIAFQAGKDHKKAYQSGWNDGAAPTNQNQTSVFAGKGKALVNMAVIGGGALSAVGSAWSSKNAIAGSITSGIGNTISGAGQGAIMGASLGSILGPHGVAIGAIVGGVANALGSIPGIVEAFNNRLQEKADQAAEKAQKSNIKRAEAKEKVRGLEDGIKDLKELGKKRFDSDEDMQAWLDANNALFEKFPELAVKFDEAGNSIVNLTSAEAELTAAREAASNAARQAAADEYDKAKAELEEIKARKISTGYVFDGKATSVLYLPSEQGKALREAGGSFVSKNLTDIYGRYTVNGPGQELISQQYLRLLQSGLDFTDAKTASWAVSLKDLSADQMTSALLDNLMAGSIKLLDGLTTQDIINKYTGIEDSKLLQEYNKKASDLDAANRYVDATRANKIAVETSAALSGVEDTYNELESANEVIESFIVDEFSFDDLGNKITGEIDTNAIFTAATGLGDQFTALYTNLLNAGKIDEFNELIQKALTGNITKQNFITELTNFSAGQDIIDAYLKYVEDNILLSTTDFATALNQREKTGSRQLKYNRLALQANKLTEQNRKDIIDNEIEFLEAQIKAGKITDAQASQYATAYANQISNFNGDQALIDIFTSGDLTNLEGIQAVEKALQDAGWDGELNWSTLIPPQVINFTTSYENLMDKTITSLEEMSETFDTAAGEMDIKDAQEVAKKLGKDVSIFDQTYFTREGETFLATQKAINLLKEEQAASVQKEADKYLEAITAARTDIKNLDTRDELLNKYGDTAAAAVTWAKENIKDFDQKATPETMEVGQLQEVINQYYTALEENIIAGSEEYTTYLNTQLQALSKIQNKAFNAKKNLIKEALPDNLNIAEGLQESAYSLLGKLSQDITTTLDETEYALFNEIFKDKEGKGLAEKYLVSDGAGGWKFDVTKINEFVNTYGDNFGLFVHDLIYNSAISAEEEIESFLSNAASLGEEKGKGKTVNENDLRTLFEPLIGTLDEGIWIELLGYFLSNNLDGFLSYLKESGVELDDKSKAAVGAGFTEYWSGASRGVDEAFQDLLDAKYDYISGKLSRADIMNLAAGTEEEKAYKEKLVEFSNKIGDWDSLTLEQQYAALDEVLASDTNLTDKERFENRESERKRLLEESQGQTLVDFGKRRDEMYDLIAETGGKGLTAEEVASLESLYGELTKVATLDGWDVVLPQNNQRVQDAMAKYRDTLAENAAKGAEELLSAMAEGTLTAAEIWDYFKKLDIDITYQKAEELANGTVDSLFAEIKSQLDGADIVIDTTKLQELAALILDSILSSISSGISSLGSGLEGTLGAADYQNLAKKYDLTGIGTTRSSKGIRLGVADQQKLISKMFLEAQNAGLSAEFGDQLWEVWRDSTEDAIDGYTAIEEEIAKAKDGQAELTGETKAYVEALQQARAAAMFDENAAEFAFMEQDATGGLTKNFDKFVDGIDKVKEVFGTFKSGKDIGYQDFYNIMDFIKNSESGFTKFSKMTGLAAGDYEAFVNSVVANTDKWGKVDIGGVAAQLGISVDTAMKSMSESMAEGLKDVAKQQIKYLSGLEQMLEALAALESIGDISLGLGLEFTTTTGETVTIDTLNDIVKYWEILESKDQIDLIAKLKPVLEKGDSAIDTALRQVFGEGFSLYDLLGGETFFTTEGFDIGSIEAITSLTGLTEGQAINLAIKMNAKIGLEEGTDFTIDEKGIRQYTESGYQKILEYVKQNYKDFYKIEDYVFDFEIANKANVELAQQGITVKDLQIQNWEKMEGDLQQAAKEKVETTYAKYGLEIEVSPEGKIIATPNLEEEAKTINADFTTAAAAASTLETAITNISTVSSSFQAGSGFQSLADQLNAAASAAKELVSALTGQEIESPDISALQAELAAAQAYLDSLNPFSTDAKGNAIQVDYAQLDAAEDKVKSLQTQLKSLQGPPAGVASGIIGELEKATNIANKLSEALSNNNSTPLEVNFNADDANGQVITLITNLLQLNDVFVPTITVDMAQAQSDIAEFLMSYVEVVETSDPVVEVSAVTEPAATQLQDIINKLSAIESKEVTIKVKTIYETIGSSGGLTDDGTTKAWTGTVNNITGSSFANGNVSALNAGAKLANKILVGELGPELAVYDGQYHLLGQTGAEFVKLPNDALIFNHLQTEGIISGQMKNARAKAFKGRADSAIAKAMGSAMATGNVAGPAFASGIAGALSAVRRAKSVWQGLLNSLSAADLTGAGGGGGGGGDNNLKAHIEDLQEWYNLSRQIAKIEQEINTLLAKRKNITDGHEYLKNLRETQKLLTQQVATQQVLVKYQQQQLEAQAEHINNNKIWSQFLTVGEDGLLQYKEGNETNGGKGSLSVLQQMNEMSGEEQVDFLAKLGYSYTDNDGNNLEGEELVAKFFEELQKQIDDYDALADTVAEAEKALADLESEIVEIEKEIRNNEIDLSKQIYDIIVDAWEENIKNLKEQNDLIKEANEAYADGIQEAIDTERQMYEQNQAISDREQLQRQLALLRRSGGSASEIADLEAQLDDMLKDEYFANQEEALETIRDANERQVELMDQQVKIQEEQLEYQKENGIIWMKVYEIMEGTDAEILDFMQGNSTTFFQQSTLQQEDMLTEWAKKIGIYTEERQRYNYNREIDANDFTNSLVSEDGKTDYTSTYNKLKDTEKDTLKSLFEKTYTNARLDSKSEAEALKLANEAVQKFLKDWKKAWDAASKQSSNSGGSSNIGNSSSINSSSDSSDSSSKKTNYHYIKVGDDFIGVNSNGSKSSIISYIAKKSGKSEEEVKKQLKTIKHYTTGGLINYTGPAWVDGSKSKPERILSAEQNKILEDGLAMAAGRGETLKETFSSFASSLGSSIREAVSNITKNTDNSNFTIASGAVQLQIAQLNDKYDVDELFNDVTDKIYSIAARASGRSVSRR